MASTRFLRVAAAQGKGVFALVQTSNPSAGQIQQLRLDNGLTVCEQLGALINEWATSDGLVGECGYSALGAVVAPQDAHTTSQLRSIMPNCLFLVPGFGVQGRTAEQVKACFRSDGTGAIVNASRSIIYAYEDVKYLEMYSSEWTQCVEQACRDMIRSLQPALSF